jgi:hypothetical protein
MWFSKNNLFWGNLIPDEDPGHGTVIVTVLEPNGRSASGASVSMNGAYKGSTDNRGALTIRNISSGNHQISAENISLRGSTQIQVRGGQTILIRIQLRQEGCFSGE